jgi:hypothetical protein
MSRPVAKNTLEVGTNGRGEVVVNHPDLQPDENGVGHIVFSIAQAEAFAFTILKKVQEARAELHPFLGPVEVVSMDVQCNDDSNG